MRVQWKGTIYSCSFEILESLGLRIKCGKLVLEYYSYSFINVLLLAMFTIYQKLSFSNIRKILYKG